MPQTAPSRTPRAGLDRRSRGGAAAAFAPADDRVDAKVEPAREARRSGRFAARLAAALFALCWGLGPASGAHAQETGGQIYIAGPGDHSGADAAKMSAMLATPARGGAASGAYAPNAAALARAANPSAAPRANDEAASGTITIPGPGERPAPGSQADAPQIVTIPAPGASAPAAAARSAASALPRVSVGSAASRVAAVVVDGDASEPATAANTASINAATARANVIQRYAAAAANRNANPNTSQNPAAQPVPPGQQDGESIRAAALAFLQQQSVGLPGHVTVTVAPVFPRGLAACTSLEPFMPPGARSWGRTTVGVRCVGAKPWTLYVTGRVAVDITYYTAARQIEPGQTVALADLVPREGDLASLPRTVITDPSQATGALALLRISAGLPLRTDMLRSAASVTIGQTVKVIAVGSNFTISAEGSVMNNAAPGEQVRVRTAGGQIITGVVKDAGTVQVQI